MKQVSKVDGSKGGKGAKGKPGKSGRGKKILWTALGILISLILVVHLFLPAIILKAVNKKLAEIPGHHAHIKDIDISLLRGAYALNGFVLQKLEAGDTLPVFSARRGDFSVEWSALLRGKLVSEISLDEPRLTLRPGPPDDTSSFDFAGLRRIIEDLFPFTINRFDIENGTIHYQDLASIPPVNLHMDRVNATARGLTNAQDLKKPGDEEAPLPASFRLTARALGHAPLSLNLAVAPLAERPTFDMDAELKALNLVALNAFFRAYANVDVERGTFGVFTEIAAADGRFTGYIKPLTKDLKVLDLDKDGGNPVRVAWEALVAGVAQLVENQPEEQVGTKIAFQGTFSNPDADLSSTIIYLLRNAFIRALQPGIENSIRLEGGPTLKEQKSQKKKEAKKS